MSGSCVCVVRQICNLTGDLVAAGAWCESVVISPALFISNPISWTPLLLWTIHEVLRVVGAGAGHIDSLTLIILGSH